MSKTFAVSETQKFGHVYIILGMVTDPYIDASLEKYIEILPIKFN